MKGNGVGGDGDSKGGRDSVGLHCLVGPFIKKVWRWTLGFMMGWWGIEQNLLTLGILNDSH